MLRRCMRKRQEHEQHKLVVLVLLPLSQSIIHFSRVYYIRTFTAHKIVTIQALVRPMYLAVVVVDVFWLRSASIRGNSSNDFGVS